MAKIDAQTTPFQPEEDDAGTAAPSTAKDTETNPDVKTPREAGRTRDAQDIDTRDVKKPAPEGAYEKLADAQADQYLAMTKALDPLTSGSALPSIDSQMSAGASAMLGGAGGAYLNQQTAAAQQQAAAAGVPQAMQATAAAEDSNSSLISGGLKALGTAETQEIESAPYQQLLSSLAAAVPSRLAENYQVPAAAQDLLAGTAWGKQLAAGFGLTGAAGSTTAGTGSTTGAPTLPAPSTGTTTYSPPTESNPATQ